ncbi:MAG: DUF4043 family protein [Magnetococcus sp. WYHC-3]
MSVTSVAGGLTPTQWDDRFFVEYTRANRFKVYMGTGVNNIIQVRTDLTKSKGDAVVFGLVGRLSGGGVTGNATLEGQEEALETRSHLVRVDALRHAVVVSDWEQQKSAIDLREAAMDQLRLWAMDRLRRDIIAALHSVNGVGYTSASEAQKDAWLTGNSDRVLFGAARSNTVAGDHSASLANLDNSADKLSPSLVSLARRMAMGAQPALRPVTVGQDVETFVLFVPSRAFRDLSTHADMMQANRDAQLRGVDNPLFKGGDLLWDGVVIKEIPEIPTLAGAGAAGIDVSPCFLCGAQAVGVAWAQRTRSTVQKSDYEFQHGVGIQEIRGVEKLRFGTGATDTESPRDHGVLTLYVAAVADA